MRGTGRPTYLGVLNPLVVQHLDRLVLGRIRPNLVGVELDGELLVEGLDLLFVVRFRHAENVVGVPELGLGVGLHGEAQVQHKAHHGPAQNDGDEALDLALLAPLRGALGLYYVMVFGLVVGLDPGCERIGISRGPQQVVGQRERDDGRQREYEERVKEKGYGKAFHSLRGVEEEYVDDLLKWVNQDLEFAGRERLVGHTEMCHVCI